MCGLVGMAGTLEVRHIDAFKDLLVFNTPRGRDSTGVWGMDRDKGRKIKDDHILKATVNAIDLMDMKGFDRVANGIKYCIIGHGRSATVGKINRMNAHPFVFDNVAGAHNGTIPQYQMTKLENHDKFGTDSEALYYNIDKYGIEATIGALTGGAWALTWYDKTDHSINFLRNEQRPLFFAYINDNKTLVWGSEAEVIHAACGRRGIETDELVFSLPTDTWYKIKLPDERDAKLPKPIVKEVKCKEVASTSSYNSGNNFRYQPGQHSSVGNGTALARVGTDSGKSSPLKSFPGAKVISIDKYKNGRKRGETRRIMGWNGRQLDEEQFKKLTGETCAYSDQIVTFEDVIEGREKIAFINEEQFVLEEHNNPLQHMWLGRGLIQGL